jgi:hypothetical protein
MFIRDIWSYLRKKSTQLTRRLSQLSQVNHGDCGLVISVLGQSKTLDRPVVRSKEVIVHIRNSAHDPAPCSVGSNLRPNNSESRILTESMTHTIGAFRDGPDCIHIRENLLIGAGIGNISVIIVGIGQMAVSLTCWRAEVSRRAKTFRTFVHFGHKALSELNV